VSVSPSATQVIGMRIPISDQFKSSLWKNRWASVRFRPSVGARQPLTAAVAFQWHVQTDCASDRGDLSSPHGSEPHAFRLVLDTLSWRREAFSL